MKNPYRWLGMWLCLVGALLAALAHLIMESVPVTAVGISTLVVGIVCLALPNYRPYVSPEASEMLFRSGAENVAALLEGLRLEDRALYLPSSTTNGRPQAVIPLARGTQASIEGRIPRRLIVRYGAGPDDVGIAIATPGTVGNGLLRTVPGSTAEEIEGALLHVLVGTLDLADSVTVSVSDSRVDILVRGGRLHYGEETWYQHCVGSPIASVAAAICSEAFCSPVRIRREHVSRGQGHIGLEVLP
ncbi:MAG: hypothetical protein QUS33_00705 [Dehalococcoidia bacterium]|nr:hypothetical protein [Dehalococcoidia bacterium]